MLKFGIHSLEQLKNPARERALWGDLKNVAIDLYDRVEGMPDAEQLSEKILLSFTDRTRIYKRTYNSRFEKFDEEALEILSAKLVRLPVMVVLDLAVSDARTSVDFYRRLSSSFSNLQFYALDFDPEIVIIQNGSARLALNNENQVLQIVRPPFVFNVTNRDSYRLYPFNNVVRFFYQHFAVPRILKQYRSGQVSQRKLLLFSQIALRLAKEDKRFHLERHNILEPFSNHQQASVIRAMNIFNLDNFSRQQTLDALHNIFQALVPGGIFITGSNQAAGSVTDGGIYAKTESGFELIQSTGKGSIVRDLIVHAN